jgi:hypothetical protein
MGAMVDRRLYSGASVNQICFKQKNRPPDRRPAGALINDMLVVPKQRQ